VFEKPGELWLIDISHLTVFDERNEKPECKSFRTMEQELSYDEIHSLDIVNLSFVVRESY